MVLILDGNYLLQKNISFLWKSKILYSELYNVIEKDFNILTRLFNFKEIYFISDSGSWRKEYYPDYKGTRKKDDDIDWKFVYQEYDELKKALSGKKMVQQIQIDKMEGDDIIGFLVNNLNKKGISTFIVTSDSDIYELIKKDDKELKYINIMYNYKYNDEKVFVPLHYKMYIDNVINSIDDNIFKSNDDYDFIEFFQKFIQGKQIVEIDSEFELFRKIMGHGKDNIKSIFIQGNRGIGEVGIKAVYSLYKATYPKPIDFDSQEFQNNLINIILYMKKVDNSFDTSIRQRLRRNLKIVKLDEKSTPPHLYENMKNIIKL
jgi:5'-3' exonuclease